MIRHSRQSAVYVFRGRIFPCLIAALLLFISFTAIATADPQRGAIHAGDSFWEPELSPDGPMVVIISLSEQMPSAYRNGIRVGYSSISSGVKGRITPTGVFTILEKEATHFSNKYHHAPMPYMQRLTWLGVAMHAGELPGYPASHGCIRLPREFAKKLYSLTVRGTTVIVVDEKSPGLTFAMHPGLLLSSQDAKVDIRPAGAGEFEWNPERSKDGPISILVSGTDKTVYVYRNGIAIGHAALTIDLPKQPLGGHAFTMLAGVTERASAFVPGRPSHKWMAAERRRHHA